jgi:hypothetical protein
MEPVLADKHPYDKQWTEIGSMQLARIAGITQQRPTRQTHPNAG